MLGYKVVRLIYGDDDEIRYRSAYKLGNPVYYEIGKKTNRPDNCGPLAVFDLLVYASSFMRESSNGKFVIFECDYEPTTGKKELWCESHKIRILKLPLGTNFADSVTLIRRL